MFLNFDYIEGTRNNKTGNDDTLNPITVALSSPDNFTVTVLTGNQTVWESVNILADIEVDKIRVRDGRSSLWASNEKIMNAKVFGKIYKGFEKAAKGTAYMGPVIIDEYKNFKDNASISEHVADTGVNFTATWASIKISALAGTKAGSLAGSYFPGVGNLIGGTVGFVTGVGTAVIIDGISIKGKTLKQWTQHGVKIGIDKARNFIGNMFD